jgi:DMSO reductase anchor subunit
MYTYVNKSNRYEPHIAMKLVQEPTAVCKKLTSLDVWHALNLHVLSLHVDICLQITRNCITVPLLVEAQCLKGAY